MTWLTGTAFFLATYASPCRRLPPPGQLQFYEMGGGDQDIFAGVAGTDSRGLKHFPRLWCAAAGRAAPRVWASRLAACGEHMHGAASSVTAAQPQTAAHSRIQVLASWRLAPPVKLQGLRSQERPGMLAGACRALCAFRARPTGGASAQVPGERVQRARAAVHDAADPGDAHDRAPGRDGARGGAGPPAPPPRARSLQPGGPAARDPQKAALCVVV